MHLSIEKRKTFVNFVKRNCCRAARSLLELFKFTTENPTDSQVVLSELKATQAMRKQLTYDLIY
jgi:hypothetical protein